MTYKDFYTAVKGNFIMSRMTGRQVNRTDLYFRSSENELHAIIHRNSVNFYLEKRPEYSTEPLTQHPAILS